MPTDESAPLVVPDPLNPRYSYGGGKIISELMAINYGRKHFERVLIFRPHNVYGPDMGFEHVIPQFAMRLKRAIAAHPDGKLPFAIQGERRARRAASATSTIWCAGVMVMREQRRASRHLSCRHHRRDHIADLARRMAAIAGREIELRPSAGAGRQHAAPLPRYSTSWPRSAIDLACTLDAGLPPTWTGIGRTSTCAARLSRLPSSKQGDLRCFQTKVARAAGTGASVPVECCQVCGHAPLETVLSLGYMPPVNQMVPIGEVPRQQPWFPTNLLYCANCELVQLGLAVDPVIIFPPEYPYTSGMTKLLRDNFAELYAESSAMLGSGPKDDLVIDIGSNDGTLLSNFQNGGHRVLGIEPTEVGKIADGRGIPTLHALLHAGDRRRGEAPAWRRARS